MSKVLVTDQYLTDIADSIRYKAGTDMTYKPGEMAGAIRNISGGGSPIIVDNPSYFIAETVDTINKVRSAMVSSACMLIPFITDTHVYTSSNNEQYFDAQIAAMRALCHTIPPTLIVHGGDMSNGSETKTIDLQHSKHQIDSLREIAGNNVLICVGNHDGNAYYNSGSDPILESEMITNWRYWPDGFTYPEGKLYGYRDYSNGVRIIKLHSYMGDGTGADGNNWGFPADEVSWFRDVALNTSNTIVIFTHMTFTPEYQGTQASNLPHNGETMRGYLETWVDNGGKCAGVFSGHAHWDYQAKHDNFYETITCLGNYLPSYGTEDAPPTSSYRVPPTGAIFRGRTQKTATQGLWDAIVINPVSETVELIRFGAGNDRTYSYGDQAVAVTGVTLSESSGSLQEGNTVTLTATVTPSNASVKTVSWSSSDTTVATVSGGLVTAVGAGEAVITVRTVDGGFTATYTLTVTAVPKVNALLSAVDANGNPYNNGQGWRSGYRLGSSGAESASSSNQVTGFIPMVKGQTMTLENIELPATNYSGYNTCYIAVYNSSKTCIKSNYSKDWHNTSFNPSTADSNNHIVKITINEGINHEDLTSMAYIRISTLQMSTESAIYID